MSVPTAQRALLLVMAIGLIPVALSYGAHPGQSLPWLFGIDASDVPTRHIFRAIMGLYLALILFWALGAGLSGLRRPALWSLFVFTSGLALGRALSLALDGWPGVLLFAYLPAEVVIAALAGWLILKAPERPA